jgi:hypothetical protein
MAGPTGVGEVDVEQLGRPRFSVPVEPQTAVLIVVGLRWVLPLRRSRMTTS